MPAFEPTKKQKLAAAAAATAAAIGIGIASFRARDYAAPVDVTLTDAGLSRTSGETRTTDLLTGPVQPGASVTTGVNLPPGSRVTDLAMPDGFSAGSGNHTDSEDATWYEVSVTNTGETPKRFVGFVSFDVPAADAGI